MSIIVVSFVAVFGISRNAHFGGKGGGRGKRCVTLKKPAAKKTTIIGVEVIPVKCRVCCFK